MRIGVGVATHGVENVATTSAGAPVPAPTWPQLREQALAAEEVGFDLCVVDDQLIHGEDGVQGTRESVSIAAALAAVTSRIHIGHSVMNPPYRGPVLMAKTAVTLDDISGGRYVFGVGAGNTREMDYKAVGVPADKRYSRLAEALEIIHLLLNTGRADFHGRYYDVENAVIEPAPSRGGGPPIVVAAWGPKMMRLAARFADEWNGFVFGPQAPKSFEPMIHELERACEEVGRDPTTISRSVDLGVDTRLQEGLDRNDDLAPFLIGGTTDEIAEQLLAFADLGIETVRCQLYPQPHPERRAELTAALADVVSALHEA